VLASTPGRVKPIFRTVSKLIVLFGMGECDYRQEQEPFQGRLLQLRVVGLASLQDGAVGIGVKKFLKLGGKIVPILCAHHGENSKSELSSQLFPVSKSH
jgi:hypothetical protein